MYHHLVRGGHQRLKGSLELRLDGHKLFVGCVTFVGIDFGLTAQSGASRHSQNKGFDGEYWMVVVPYLGSQHIFLNLRHGGRQCDPDTRRTHRTG